MIVTVTMNPAIDKTVEIDQFIHGGLNRIKSVEYDAGGKGINVSKALKKLGTVSAATGFLGGSGGKTIEKSLNQMGIHCDFIFVNGETRTNTKICERNGVLTELNEPGLPISHEKVNELMKKLESYANPETMFILSGSVPKGTDKSIYAEITRRVHKKGAAVLIDADGELLKNAIEAKPDIIKPNTAELEEYTGTKLTSDNEILNAANALKNKGIGTIAVSMGGSGAVIAGKDYAVKCPALSVDVHSTVGAGDAMAAALAYSWENNLSNEETAKMCIAVSAGAVTTVGTKPPDIELVNKLKSQVIIEKYN